MREKNIPRVEKRFHTITNRDCGKNSTMVVEFTIQDMPKTSLEKTPWVKINVGGQSS
jgi:hypothetical protein